MRIRARHGLHDIALIVEELPFFDHVSNRFRHHFFPIGVAVADFSEYFAGQNTEAVGIVVVKVINTAPVKEVAVQLL